MVDRVNELKIRTYPNPVLKEKAEEIKNVDEEIRQLADKMIRAMQLGGGAGLAGPQVGISKRIFVIDADDGKGPRVFINPQIFKKRGRQTKSEGCLSLPGIEAEVRRTRSLHCRFLDKRGKEREISARDLLARIILHENDHLDGKLFIDRIGWLRRRKLLQEYQRYNDMIEGGRI